MEQVLVVSDGGKCVEVFNGSMSSRGEPPVNNDPAIAALSIVESAGEARTWWLRKMQAEVQKSVDDGKQVFDIEIHRMLSQYRDDVQQWGSTQDSVEPKVENLVEILASTTPVPAS
jgi:hypothetical protein